MVPEEDSVLPIKYLNFIGYFEMFLILAPKVAPTKLRSGDYFPSTPSLIRGHRGTKAFTGSPFAPNFVATMP